MDDQTGTMTQGVTSANAQGAELVVESATTNTNTQITEEAFDKERALETIRKQRASEEALTKESKRLAKIVSEYEAKEKKQKEAQLSEVDQLKAQLAEQVAANAQIQNDIRQSKLRAAIERAAGLQGFVNPEDAWKLADLSGLEMGEDGKVKGLEEALKEILKTRPYLTAAAIKQPNNNARDTGRGNKEPDPDARKKELAQRFRIKV